MSTSSGSVPEPEGYEDDEKPALKVMLAYYQYAGSQLSLSLRQRDYVVLLYLAAVATVFGTAFAKHGVQVSLLVLIPFLSLGAAMLSMLHHVRVGVMNRSGDVGHERFITRCPDRGNPSALPISRADGHLTQLSNHCSGRFAGIGR